MEPIKLEILVSDLTRAGMQSVKGNLNEMKQYASSVISLLEKELADMQSKAKQAASQGIVDQRQMADIQAMTGVVNTLKEELAELEKQKRKTDETPIMQHDPAPKLNSVKMSMQQIARELPSLAMGPQMFFLAISNNIPMFTDAVAAARKEHDLLVASNQKATPVWKQLLSSLFSWQTLMAAGITLSVVYGKEIGNWISQLWKGKSAASSMADAQGKMNESMQTADLGKQVVTIRSLQERWNKLGDNLQEKKKFITENKDEFDKLGVAVNNVGDAENLLVTNTPAFIEAMGLRAEAAAAFKLATEEAEKALQTQIEIDKKKKAGPSIANKVTSFLLLDPQWMPGSLANQKGMGRSQTAWQLGIESKEQTKKVAEEDAKTYTQVYNEKLIASAKKLAEAGIKEQDKNKPSGGKSTFDYQQELADARIRADKATEEARIKVLQEGYEKRRELAKLEYNEQLDEINKRESTLVKKLDSSKKEGKDITGKDYDSVHAASNVERKAVLSIYEYELDQINAEASEKERKKLEEYMEQFQGYISKRTSTEKVFDDKRTFLRNNGASEETLGELDHQEQEALAGIDKTFAERETAFQSWADSVVNLSLQELQKLLIQASQELERAEFLNPGDPGLATKRAKVNTLRDTYTKKAVTPDKDKDKDTKRSIKEWQELNRTLGDVENSFNDIGGTVGDVAGDIIKTAGTIATSTLQIIDGITTLTESSADGMKGTADVAATSISNVEKASVILAIISAALKIATAIAGLFSKTDYMAEFRKEMAKLNYELELVKLNAEISRDKNSIFGDDLWGNATKNISLANEALGRYNKTLEDVANRKKYTGLLGMAAEAAGVKNTYDSLGDSIANMEIKIRHKTLFRSAKYASLKDAVPELFNEDGTINQDALGKFIGTDTFGKLSAENQQYLQQMSDYWKSYEEAVKQVKDYLSDIFGDLGNTLTDTLVDSWVNGTDAAQEYYKSVSEMLEKLGKQMIYSAVFGDIFEKAQEEMLGITQDESLSSDEKFKKYIDLMGKMTDDVLGKQGDFNKLLEAYQQMAKDKGFDLYQPDKDDSSQSGRAGAVTTITEETAGKLEGIGNASLDHLIQIDENTFELATDLSAMASALNTIAENSDYLKKLDNIADGIEELNRGVKMK